MNVLAFLVPVALVLGVVWVAVFMWTLKSGQYDDLEGEALRILDDEADEKPLSDSDADTSGGDATRNATGASSDDASSAGVSSGGEQPAEPTRRQG